MRVDGPWGRGFLRGLSLTRLTVSRSKGRPFYGQAMGQLRLTCTFSAECAQREGCGGRPSRRRGASMNKTITTGLSPGEKHANRPAGGESKPTAPGARGNAPPSAACGGVFPQESVSHDSHSPKGFLRIVFACHPGGAELLFAYPLC